MSMMPSRLLLPRLFDAIIRCSLLTSFAMSRYADDARAITLYIFFFVSPICLLTPSILLMLMLFHTMPPDAAVICRY